MSILSAELREVTPTDPTVARQWELVNDQGVVVAVKKRYKIPPPPTPKEKTTHELLEEILAKLP